MVVNLDSVRLAAARFHGAKPFPHAVIDDFFDARVAAALAVEFGGGVDEWHSYDSPLEVKRTCNDWNRFGQITYQTVHWLNAVFVEELKRMLFIHDLACDPGLNGGGWHAHGRGGKLNVHQDYDCHPKLHRMQRRLNLIVYLNPRWQPEWGGELGLYASPSELVHAVTPRFNRAVLFDTRGSWHGLPAPVMCPEGEERQSLAVYYLTPTAPESGRTKALFAPTAEQAGDPAVLELIERRARGEAVYRTG